MELRKLYYVNYYKKKDLQGFAKLQHIFFNKTVHNAIEFKYRLTRMEERWVICPTPKPFFF